MGNLGAVRQKLERRLSGYWKMEAGNAVLLPALGAAMIFQADGVFTWTVLLAMAACAALLVVGAWAWRIELAKLKGDRDMEARVLPWLAAAQFPSLVLSLAACAGAAFQVWNDDRWTPAGIGAVIFASLAVLEYVNYYHVQLQHFDHPADFARLLRGRGFARAHLAKAVRRRRKLPD